MLGGTGEGDGVGVKGEACFGTWLEAGPLAEGDTEGWRQGVGLWDLLREGPAGIAVGDGVGEGLRVWVGVTGVEVRGRAVCVGVGIGEGIGV